MGLFPLTPPSCRPAPLPCSIDTSQPLQPRHCRQLCLSVFPKCSKQGHALNISPQSEHEQSQKQHHWYDCAFQRNTGLVPVQVVFSADRMLTLHHRSCVNASVNSSSSSAYEPRGSSPNLALGLNGWER